MGQLRFLQGMRTTTTCDRCKSTVSTEARMAAREAQALKTNGFSKIMNTDGEAFKIFK